MPTVLLLDVSLSMCRTLALTDASEPETIRSVAVRGLIAFLDQMYMNCKLEFTSLLIFSSLYEKAVEFTRDIQRLKQVILSQEEFYDKTNVINALTGANEVVMDEWGPSCPLVNIVLVTDGEVGVSSLDFDPAVTKLKFLFPCKLDVVLLGSSVDPSNVKFYETLIDNLGLNGKIPGSNSVKGQPQETQVHVPESMSMTAVDKIFQKLAEQNYQTWKGKLFCGNLFSPITLSPPLETRKLVGDFEVLTAKPSGDIKIIGFMDITEIASPPAASRHLILSIPMTKEELASQPSIMNLLEKKDDTVVVDPDEEDGGKQPSLCVLLHGSLKVEGLVAICIIGDVTSSTEGTSPSHWFGILYSWADSKKKFNLMLSTFDCLTDCIPWLNPFESLGHSEVSSVLPPSQGADLKKGKRSYHSQNTVVWIRNQGLQADVQKIIRLAKRLPEKAGNFYKELSRFRKAAASFGFYEAMTGLATILDKEFGNLPPTANPEIKQHIQYAVKVLQSRESFDADIIPPRN